MPAYQSPNDAFVGREAELQALDEAVELQTRLVAIVGMGGIGKTRLVYESLRTSVNVRVVELAACATEEGLLAAVAAVLNPRGSTTGFDLVATMERLGTFTLVLDAVESVLDHLLSPLEQWLRDAPNVRFVLTSRLPIHIRGSHTLLLGPLLPDDSFELLVRRAKESDIRFDPTSQADELRGVVARLDGIPLAIELASARLHVLSPRQLLKRLHDRLSILRTDRSDVSPRHTGLRATLDDAWNTLSPTDRTSLSALSIFTHPFEVSAATTVLGLEDDAALDCIQRLVGRGFIHVSPNDPERYLRMVDVLREYAAHELPEARSLEVQRRHAQHYRDQFAELLTARGMNQLLAQRLSFDNLDQTIPHLDAMLDRPGLDSDLRRDVGIVLAALLITHRPVTSLHRALQVAREEAIQTSRRRLAIVVFLESISRDFLDTNVAELDDVIDAFRFMESIGDEPGWAALLAGDISARVRFSDFESALQWADTAQVHADASGNADIRFYVKNLQASYRLFEQSLPESYRMLSKLLDDPSMSRDAAFNWLMNRAWLLYELGTLDEAIADIERALDIGSDRTEPIARVGALTRAAILYFAAGRRELAYASLGEACSLGDRYGVRDDGAYGRVHVRGLFSLAEGRDSDAAAAMELSEPVGTPRSTRGLVALFSGDLGAAHAHLKAALQTARASTGQGLRTAFYAIALGRLGQSQEALQTMEQAWSQTTRWQSRRVDAVLDVLDLALTLHQGRPNTISEAWARLNAQQRSTEPQFPMLLIATRLLRAALEHVGSPIVVHVGPDVAWVQVNDAKPMELTRRPVWRSLLHRLVEEYRAAPGRPIPAQTMLDAAWPADRSRRETLENRLWSALSKMRRAGLGEVIRRVEGGYLIPEAVLVFSRETPLG
ncbi:MAG: hypothetical protein AAGA48_08240 [Myxococcota bacterium]